MAVSTSVLSALLKQNVSPELVDLLFRDTPYLNLLRAAGCVKDGVGPSPFQWNVATASNSSFEVFSEGQAPPVSGRQTYVQAQLSAFYVRDVWGMSGHVRDNLRKSGYHQDVAQAESMLAESDLFKGLEDQLMGSTQDRGVAAIIDSTGTYANLAQGTYSIWASEENDASSAALTIAMLQTLHREMKSASVSGVARGAKSTHWLMPPNQFEAYQNTVGAGNGTAANRLVRFASDSTDLGFVAEKMTFNNLPIEVIPTMTSTELYLVDIRDIELLIHRDLEVVPIVGNPENEQWQLSFAVAHKVKSRNKHGKIINLT